ncbi:MAG: inositol monophosphatase, partial [Planctomycetes bacterium]|nr:inositol monophosphatase [Planctomycetota bacterium]
MARKYSEALNDLEVEKKSEKDLVSEADVAIEQYLRKQISSHYPDHGILGEEEGEVIGNNSEYRWIIDPIDGTASFLHGQPFYSISIAIEKEGELYLAAIYGPALNELFMATKGQGATLNGCPIKVSTEKSMTSAIYATGFACLRSNLKHNNLPYLTTLLPQIQDIRRYGSAALDLCFVAAGRVEGFWELNLNIYDVAAGILIVREAGGIVSDFSGNEKIDGQ